MQGTRGCMDSDCYSDLTKTWHLGRQLLIINVAFMQMYKRLSSMYEAAVKACCRHNQPAHQVLISCLT